MEEEIMNEDGQNSTASTSSSSSLSTWTDVRLSRLPVKY